MDILGFMNRILGLGEPRSTATGFNFEHPEQGFESPRPRGLLVKLPSARTKTIHTVKPNDLNCTQTAAERLKAGQAVVVNLHGMDTSLGQRLVDVLSGVCLGIDGNVDALGDRMFLFAPPEITIDSAMEDAPRRDGVFFEAPASAAAAMGGLGATPELPDTTAAGADEDFDLPEEYRTGLFAR